MKSYLQFSTWESKLGSRSFPYVWYIKTSFEPHLLPQEDRLQAHWFGTISVLHLSIQIIGKLDYFYIIKENLVFAFMTIKNVLMSLLLLSYPHSQHLSNICLFLKYRLIRAKQMSQKQMHKDWVNWFLQRVTRKKSKSITEGITRIFPKYYLAPMKCWSSCSISMHKIMIAMMLVPVITFSNFPWLIMWDYR